MLFVLGLAVGLALAILVGAIGRALARSISIQLPAKWQRKGKGQQVHEEATSVRSSTSRRSRPALKVVPTDEDDQLAAALRHWQFSRAEVEHAVSATREFKGPMAARVKLALQALRREA